MEKVMNIGLRERKARRASYIRRAWPIALGAKGAG